MCVIGGHCSIPAGRGCGFTAEAAEPSQDSREGETKPQVRLHYTCKGRVTLDY